jgi:hypothetical protein
MPTCRVQVPRMHQVDDEHFAACHLLEGSRRENQGSAA